MAQEDGALSAESENQPRDPHPPEAWLDGEKLAVLGCECPHCIEAHRQRERNRRYR